MSCACNKNRSNSLAEKRVASQPVMPAVSTTASAQTAQSAPRARTTPPVQGGQQSFALQVGDKTVRYGSRLERDATAARTGGRVV